MNSQCQTCKLVTITFSSRDICIIKTTKTQSTYATYINIIKERKGDVKTQSCHKWDCFMPIHVFLLIIKLHRCKNDCETHIK